MQSRRKQFSKQQWRAVGSIKTSLLFQTSSSTILTILMLVSLGFYAKFNISLFIIRKLLKKNQLVY